MAYGYGKFPTSQIAVTWKWSTWRIIPWIRGLPNHGARFRPLRIGMAEMYGL